MGHVLPEFSVIIATHNRPRLLQRAIESIRQQTYPCRQIIVISDADDAETYSAATRSMRAGDTFIQRKGTPGPSESRNLGIKCLSGDYVVFLDDDDTFRPDFLQNVVDQLPNYSSPGQVFYTNFEVVNETLENDESRVTSVEPIDIAGYDPFRVYVKNFIPNNCLVFPKRVVSEISFDSNIPYEDWDFILSACARAPLKHLPIFGPKVHKYEAGNGEQRGNKNDSNLVDCYIKIYGKHRSPNQAVSSWRKELFTSVGLDIDALVPGAAS